MNAALAALVYLVCLTFAPPTLAYALAWVGGLAFVVALYPDRVFVGGARFAACAAASGSPHSRRFPGRHRPAAETGRDYRRALFLLPCHARHDDRAQFSGRARPASRESMMPRASEAGDPEPPAGRDDPGWRLANSLAAKADALADAVERQGVHVAPFALLWRGVPRLLSRGDVVLHLLDRRRACSTPQQSRGLALPGALERLSHGEADLPAGTPLFSTDVLRPVLGGELYCNDGRVAPGENRACLLPLFLLSVAISHAFLHPRLFRQHSRVSASACYFPRFRWRSSATCSMRTPGGA